MPTRKRVSRFGAKYVLIQGVTAVPGFLALVAAVLLFDWTQVVFWLLAAAFAAAMGLTVITHVRVLHSFRCPTCGKSIRRPTLVRRQAGDPVVYFCDRCDVEWDTGLREAEAD
jgi:predicted RNA-binding Zn-ribbon protein involved in translation (DUF1610 family)